MYDVLLFLFQNVGDFPAFFSNNLWGIITAVLVLVFNAGAIYAALKTKVSQLEVIEIVKQEIESHRGVCPLIHEGKFYPAIEGRTLEVEIRHINQSLRRIEKKLERYIDEQIDEE
jgi:hypothetical protein